MQVKIAEFAGFCFGVKRAVEMAKLSLRETRSWYSLGPLVHNKFVVEDLRRLGLKVAESLDEVNDQNAGIIIRSHGVDKDIIEKLIAAE